MPFSKLFTKEHILFLFSLLVLFTLFSPSFFYTSETGLALFLFYCFFYFDEMKIFLIKNRKSLACLGMFILIGVVFSKIPGKSVKGAYDFLRGFVLIGPAIVVVKNYPKNKNLYEKISLFPSVFIGFLLIYLLCTFFLDSSQDRFLLSFKSISYSFGSQFGNVHNFINGVSVFLIFCVSLAIRGSLSFRWISVLWTISAFCLFFLVLLQSEGTFLALFFVLLAHIFLAKREWRKVSVFLGIFILLSFVSVFFFGSYYESYIDISLGGWKARTDIYEALLESVAQSPFFGYGINTYKYLEFVQPENHSFIMPHQIFLECLFSVGIIGLSLFLYVIARITRGFKFKIMQLSFLELFGFLVFIYLLVKGLTDMKFFSFYFSGLFFMSLGFMSANACCLEENH